jgi:hypothetical protein
VIWDRGKDLELGFEVFAQVHNRRDVSTTVAVIWCRPDSHDVFVLEVVLVAFVDELMGSSNEL